MNMPPTTRHQMIIFCATILASGVLSSCGDLRMNTPAGEERTTVTAQNKSAHTDFVLPVEGIVEYREMPRDSAIMLTGQVVCVFTPVNGSNGHLVDLDMLVELELKPPGGCELGWKIGGISSDRLNFKSRSECLIQKSFLIDETDETRKLNLLFNVDRTQLVIKRMWISQSTNDINTPDHQ